MLYNETYSATVGVSAVRGMNADVALVHAVRLEGKNTALVAIPRARRDGREVWTPRGQAFASRRSCYSSCWRRGCSCGWRRGCWGKGCSCGRGRGSWGRSCGCGWSRGRSASTASTASTANATPIEGLPIVSVVTAVIASTGEVAPPLALHSRERLVLQRSGLCRDCEDSRKGEEGEKFHFERGMRSTLQDWWCREVQNGGADGVGL